MGAHLEYSPWAQYFIANNWGEGVHWMDEKTTIKEDGHHVTLPPPDRCMNRMRERFFKV